MRLALLAVLLLAPVAAAQPESPEAVAREVLAGRTGDVPGAVVAVVLGGEIVYQEAFGLADLAHGVPMTVDTRSNIGSTSKPFTAYAVGLLAERGALSLDDDVRDFVPELPDFGETVTLRHLLTHTSGYRDFLNLLLLAGGVDIQAGAPVSRDEVIRAVQNQPALQNTPGAEMMYNNTGFALAALVVERVTGEPFGDWMEANVFAPNGLTETVVPRDARAVVPRSAEGYQRAESGWLRAPDSGAGAGIGAGGLYTTVGDLARWMAVLQTGGDHPDVVRQMATPNVLPSGTVTDYGLGLFVDTLGGVARRGHGGGDMGHTSAFMLFPELDGGVIVLSNTPDRVEAMAEEIARAFFPDAWPALAEAEVDFDDALFDAYVGDYALDVRPDFVLSVRRAAGGGYETQATGQPAFAIKPLADTTFAPTAFEARLDFHRDPDGVVRALTLTQGQPVRATRVEAATPTAAVTERLDPAPYLGRYYSDETETFFSVAEVDGALVLRHRRAGDDPLRRTDGDAFRSRMLRGIAFERDASGAVTAFVMDAGGRARDIRFERVPESRASSD